MSKHARADAEEEELVLPLAKEAKVAHPYQWVEDWRVELNRVWPNRRADLDARQHRLAELLAHLRGHGGLFTGRWFFSDDVDVQNDDRVDPVVISKDRNDVFGAIQAASVKWAALHGFSHPPHACADACAMALFDVPLAQWVTLKRVQRGGLVARASVCALKPRKGGKLVALFDFYRRILARAKAARCPGNPPPVDVEAVRRAAREEYEVALARRRATIEREVEAFRQRREAEAWKPLPDEEGAVNVARLEYLQRLEQVTFNGELLAEPLFPLPPD